MIYNPSIHITPPTKEEKEHTPILPLKSGMLMTFLPQSKGEGHTLILPLKNGMQ
jgi:hypothetical protein